MIRKLTDCDLANLTGTIHHGYCIEDARIQQGLFSDSDHYGYLLGRNEFGNYVTWQFHYDNEELYIYWGHYLSDDRDVAIHDFNTRDLYDSQDEDTRQDRSNQPDGEEQAL